MSISSSSSSNSKKQEKEIRFYFCSYCNQNIPKEKVIMYTTNGKTPFTYPICPNGCTKYRLHKSRLEHDNNVPKFIKVQKITSKQDGSLLICIPRHIANKLNILKGDLLQVKLKGNKVTYEKEKEKKR